VAAPTRERIPLRRRARAHAADRRRARLPAHPKRGDRYRQEYYPPGEALDEAHVLGERGPITVPYGTFGRALVTSEFSPLEPQTEEKYYVAGIGEILERVVKGHREEFRLVRYVRP
jgi:hypothetical protein